MKIESAATIDQIKSMRLLSYLTLTNLTIGLFILSTFSTQMTINLIENRYVPLYQISTDITGIILWLWMFLSMIRLLWETYDSKLVEKRYWKIISSNKKLPHYIYIQKELIQGIEYLSIKFETPGWHVPAKVFVPVKQISGYVYGEIAKQEGTLSSPKEPPISPELEMLPEIIFIKKLITQQPDSLTEIDEVIDRDLSRTIPFP